MRLRSLPIALFVLASPLAITLSAQQQRPMSFMDVQEMRTAAAPAVSPDGKWMLYTLTTPDWKAAKRQSDLYLVSMKDGLPSTRQLTFTKDKDEGPARWVSDAGFVFSSNRDATAGTPAGTPAGAAGATPAAGGRGGAGGGNQLYHMRTDGGEARKITDVAGGVGQFAVTRDNKWLVYASGRAEATQLWGLPANALETPAVQLTRGSTPVQSWQISKDGSKIFYLSPDTVQSDERRRLDAKFGVKIRNAVEPRVHLYMLDLVSRSSKRLTNDVNYSVSGFTISDDAKYVGFNATRDDRYWRGTLEERDAADLYLLDVATAKVERLTNNLEIPEGPLSFSPDGKWIAYSTPEDGKFMHLEKTYLRALAGGPWRKLGAGYDGPVTPGWWSDDSKTIYSREGIKATTQVVAIDVATGKVKPVTSVKGSVTAARDEVSNAVVITYTDPKTPSSYYTVPTIDQISDRAKWIRLTDANPQVSQMALGDESEITWKSNDGTSVGGVLLKPVGYVLGQKYPLIVSIHGGPAAADELTFNGGYGAQVYAGAGYMVLMPNYRASTNYGDTFKTETQGDYFTKGYQDIMTGVDYLIAQGMVDPNQMGVLGWSAGGHYSNWIETHTTRFKAISSGAGVANWVSMYGQSDTQRLRQWYLGDKMFFEGNEYENWWKQSPIATVKNAKTPMMIHVVDGDPRVPRPQSEEMHMALKRVGVPTEFFVYPGTTHGIPEARDQYTKSMSEFDWMEKWVRGKPVSFDWKELLKTVDTPTPRIQP
ncbi:MAG: prolyl oligopeptidase family serine peptidase [bacterium]